MARLPSSPDADNRLRKQLGVGVRALRKRAGLTQAALAAQAKYTQSQISRLEKGYRISAAVLDHVLAVLAPTPGEADELRRLNQVNERGREPQRPGVVQASAPWFRRILELEPHATAILSWTGERLKGLLQAESYMVEQFKGHGVDDITDAVTERAARATRAFTENPGCRYEFLISESAVDRLVQCVTMTRFVAVDQLKHLIDLGDRMPAVSIRVVPYAHLLHVDPDFTIMEFAAPEPALGYSEVPGSLVTTGPGGLDLGRLRKCWHGLRHSALSDEQTRNVLEKALDRCQGPP